MAARVSGYSQQTSAASSKTQSRLDKIFDLFTKVVTEFSGRTFDVGGTTLMAEFPSVIYALRASLKLQQETARQHESPNENALPLLRIGLHLGELVVDGQVVSGDGVEIALGLQRIAQPGSIVISSDIHAQVHGKVDSSFAYIGEHSIQNIERTINAYRIEKENDQKSFRKIFSELVRRRIFRSAGAYVVAAWLTIQASDIVLPVFNAPGWILRSLILLLIIGFPLAMLMTWSVNLSTEGIVKTTHSRYSRTTGRWLKYAVVGAAAAVSILVVFSLRTAILEPPGTNRAISRSGIKSQPVIAVAQLTKRVGDSSVDWLGQGISNLLRDSFADSPLAIVYSLAALQTLDADTDTNLVQSAKNAGVDYLIAGDYMSTSSGIVITTHIEDLQNGTIIPGDRIQVRNIEDAIAGTAQIITRLKQSLNIPYRNQVGHLAADFAAENLQAYELYVSGLQYLAAYDYENATELFEAAIEEAPGFEIAKYRLAQILEATGQNIEAIELLNAIRPMTLSEREQLYVAGAKKKFTENRDTAGAIEIFKDLVAKYPFDSEAHQNLAEAFWLDYQDNASVKQLELLVELHPKEAVSWMALGERQIDVGDNLGASVSLAKYVSMQPEDPYPHALLGQLASQESRFSDAKTYYQRALEIRPFMGIAEIGLARVEYFEGNTEAAMRRWHNIIENSNITADHRIDAAFDYAYIMRALGRPQETYDALTKVEAEIHNEGIRESLGLTVKALSLVDLDQGDLARELLNLAVEKTPASGQPTRPLFFLALFAVIEGDREAFALAIDRLVKVPIEKATVSNNDRNAAADYLTGVGELDSDPLIAEEFIGRAISTPGVFHYRLYELGLADAKVRNGNFASALNVLESIGEIDPSDPRFDLEYDRKMASLLRAEILSMLNRREEAESIIRRFIVAWPDAPEAHPAIERAQSILDQN